MVGETWQKHEYDNPLEYSVVHIILCFRRTCAPVCLWELTNTEVPDILGQKSTLGEIIITLLGKMSWKVPKERIEAPAGGIRDVGSTSGNMLRLLVTWLYAPESTMKYKQVVSELQERVEETVGD